MHLLSRCLKFQPYSFQKLIKKWMNSWIYSSWCYHLDIYVPMVKLYRMYLEGDQHYHISYLKDLTSCLCIILQDVLLWSLHSNLTTWLFSKVSLGLPLAHCHTKYWCKNPKQTVLLSYRCLKCFDDENRCKFQKTINLDIKMTFYV